MSSSANAFISHKHTDAGIADALRGAIDDLFSKRVSVSYSTKKTAGGGTIPIGADWFQWIGEQVARSRVTIVLLTPRFVAPPEWLLWEAGAVYGTALSARSHRSRVRPLLYGIDEAAVPEPIRSARLQMARGDDPHAMKRFLTELLDDFDVFTKAETFEAGSRVGPILSTYLNAIEPHLHSAANVPAIYAPPSNPDALKKALDLAITAVQTFAPAARMNGRYFYTTVDAGRDTLVRDEDVYLETVGMPEEFGMSRLDVERLADTIVICESYQKRTPIYRVLAPELMQRYPPDIRPHISPAQGWVLACPVLTGNTRPAGVICLYGRKPPAKNEAGSHRLLQIAVRLAGVFATLLGSKMSPSSADAVGG